MTSARPPTAASGSPPPTTLPKIDRSGVMPCRTCSPAGTDPEAGDDLVEHEERAGRGAARRAARSRKPGAGGTRPMFAAIGSTSDRGDLVRRRAPRRARRRRCTGTITVSATAPGVTPAEPGSPRVATPLPAAHEERVQMTVVAAGELHDRVRDRWRRAPAAPRSSRPRCRSTRVAPCPRWARDRRSPRPARPRARSVRRTTCRRARRRCTASTIARIGMPEDRRTPRLHVVDVPVAFGVDEVGALAHARRRTAHPRPRRRRARASSRRPGCARGARCEQRVVGHARITPERFRDRRGRSR